MIHHFLVVLGEIVIKKLLSFSSQQTCFNVNLFWSLVEKVPGLEIIKINVNINNEGTKIN